MIRRALLMVLPALLLSSPVFAQDDDLAPLVPSSGKSKPKAKPKPKPAKPSPKATPSGQDDDLAPLTVAKTELVVKLGGDVSGARLFIDNKEVGTLPAGAQEVSPGDHAVLVKRPGFAPFTRKVSVASGKTAEVNVELKPTMAVYRITSDPSGAQVYAGNKLLGSTPLEDVELPPGSVTFTAKREGYSDAKSEASGKAGRDQTVSIRLAALASTPIASRPSPVVEDRPQVSTLTPEPSVSDSPVTAETRVESGPPIVTRWYFWVGVVAVAGAIAAGTAIGVTQANQTKPLTQSEICGGPCDACINCAAAFKF
jgi:hypothetical protein